METSKPEALVPMETWESKFSRTEGVGILFAMNGAAIEPILNREEGYWQVYDAKIPVEVVSRRRCSNGLDLATCCSANWGKLDKDPETREPAFLVTCKLKRHPYVYIPKAIIAKIIFPRKADR